MKVSKIHLEYIVAKLNNLISQDLKEYDLTPELFADDNLFIKKSKPIPDYHYAIFPKNLEEAKIVYPYFDKTRKEAGWGGSAFDMFPGNELDVYKKLDKYACLYDSKHKYKNALDTSASYSKRITILGEDYFESGGINYKILNFEDIKDELIKYVKGVKGDESN